MKLLYSINTLSMNSVPLKPKAFCLLSFLVFLFTSCEVLKTAPYDQYSYQNTIEIKVDASRLMDKAVTPYENHLEEVEILFIDIEKMMEYEKNKPNNEITYAMWQILSDDEKNLLAGFFKRWKEQGSFSETFLTESKAQVMEAMDILIQYEGRKDPESKNKLMNIITGNN